MVVPWGVISWLEVSSFYFSIPLGCEYHYFSTQKLHNAVVFHITTADVLPSRMVESRHESPGLCSSRWALNTFVFCLCPPGCWQFLHGFVWIVRLHVVLMLCALQGWLEHVGSRCSVLSWKSIYSWKSTGEAFIYLFICPIWLLKQIFLFGFTTRHTEKICKVSSCSQNTFVFCVSFDLPLSCSNKNEKDTLNQKIHSHQRTNQIGLYGMIQFFFVTVILTVVGSRVASLVVLEFCLRAVSGWVTAGPVRNQFCNAVKMKIIRLYHLTYVVLYLYFSHFCLVYFLR